MRFVEMMQQFGGSVAAAWNSLTSSARLQLVLTGVATAGLIGLVVVWGARPDYVNLYTGLSTEDSVLVRGKLNELGVPHRIEGDGSIIQVPRGRKTNLLMDLAAEGIPASHTGGDGFEYFDTADLMASKYVNDVQLDRAINRSLERMLAGLDFVNKATVHISREEDVLFADQVRPSKAAVTLDLKRQPNPKLTDGLIGLITSHGPANLTRENVTIVTTDGVTLHGPSSDSFDGQANSMLAAKHEMDEHFRKKVEENLARIGVASVVNVSFDLEFSAESQYEQIYDKGQVVSRESDGTTVTNTERLPQGPAGAIANLPDSDAVVPGGTQLSEESEYSLENYELPVTITERTQVPGRVEKVTASAFVDAKRVEVLDDEGNPTGEHRYEPRSDEEIESFKVAIANDIGYGLTKDDVEVVGLSEPLDAVAIASAGMPGATPEGGMLGTLGEAFGITTAAELGLWAIRLLLVAGLLYLAVRIGKGLIPKEVQEEGEGLDVTVEEELDLDAARRNEITEEISRITQQEPEAVANLLRTWLAEDEA